MKAAITLGVIGFTCPLHAFRQQIMRNVSPRTTRLDMLHPLGVLLRKLSSHMIVGLVGTITHQGCVGGIRFNRIGNKFSTFPHLQNWKIAYSFTHRYMRIQALAIFFSQLEGHGVTTTEISTSDRIVSGFRVGNITEPRTEQDQAPPLLRYAIVRSEKDFCCHVVTESSKNLNNQTKYFAIA
ncbi:hypothetical protein A0O30_17220 [Pseudomonas sp. LLC-1]|nr:hypothetical protein A0O30_17220 [Pseudomonas sp. LLC-1]